MLREEEVWRPMVETRNRTSSAARATGKAVSEKNWGNRPWNVEFRPVKREFLSRVDFAVVGGGFTGLAAAAWLRRLAPEKSVALFEAETLGAGSSGHTGGIALAESATGDLPGLGDVLTGYRKILRELNVDGDVALPGVYEIGRSGIRKDSPIRWNDSGDLGVVSEVPGGIVDPGKVVGGLARAAERSGCLLFEDSAATDMKISEQLELHTARGNVRAGKILFATNAFALELARLRGRAESKFTLALATKELSDAVLQRIGVGERKPFYTADLPYLWGRPLGNALIFGSGLVHLDDWRELQNIDIKGGEVAKLLASLEARVRGLHPALRKVQFTHRWGGPICIGRGWGPVFEPHRETNNAIVLGAYSGHGVALSVYLGVWAAEALLSKKELPNWR